jgi:hypothetical protein
MNNADYEFEGFLNTISRNALDKGVQKIQQEINNELSPLYKTITDVNNLIDEKSALVEFATDNLGNIIEDSTDIISSFLSTDFTGIVEGILSIGNLGGFSKFIFGVIERPYLILNEVFNIFWDPLASFMTDSLIADDFFFKSIEEIIQEPLISTFTDLRKGLLPGTLYERPLTKHPLYPSEPDVHRVSRNDRTVYEPGGMKYNYDSARDPLLLEPKMSYNATYPYNHFMTTESGHIFEYDDTPSYERIQERHCSGTGYHINADGSRKHFVMGDEFSVIIRDNRVHIFGKLELYVDKEAQISINGDARINIARNAEIHVRRDANIHTLRDFNVFAGRNITLNAQENIKFNAKKNIETFSQEETKLHSKKLMQLYTDETFELNSTKKTKLQSLTHVEITAPLIDINYASGDSFSVKGNIPSPIGKKPHEMTIPYKTEEFTIRHEGFPGSSATISQGSIKAAMRKGELGVEEWVNRQPDIVLKKPESNENSSSGGGSIIEGVGIDNEDDLKDPANPIYDFKISKHCYVRDLTLSAYFPHYLQEQCGLSINEIVKNLSKLARSAVDPLYEHLGGFAVNTYGRPKGKLQLTSGFRKATSCRSQHEKGNAFDFQVIGLGKGYYYDMAKWCEGGLGYSAILLEYKTTGTRLPWIHVQTAGGGGTYTYLNHKLYENRFVNLLHKQALPPDIHHKVEV